MTDPGGRGRDGNLKWLAPPPTTRGNSERVISDTHFRWSGPKALGVGVVMGQLVD
jgi:hypothetical protein